MSAKQQIVTKIDQAKTALANSPIVKGLVDGGLSLIPFFGAAITSVLDARAFKLFEENSKHFAKEVNRLVNEIDEAKLDKRFVESDEFVSLLTEILAKNARTHEQEKVNLFARLFVNAATLEKSSAPYKEGFVRVIDELSAEHIRALRIIYENNSKAQSKDDNFTKVHDVAWQLRVTDERATAYCDQMIRFGLLRDWSIGKVVYSSGHYEITGYGRELAEFLKTQR